MVTAIIVDDEKHNVVMLHALLKENCPEVDLLDFANSVDEAYEKIISLKPDLVFLDIKMPGKSGFDLLKLFTEITFEVIFVSAYNEYAITAFEFNALGYILKPIDYVLLQKTVTKTISIIEAKHSSDNHNISQFVKTLEDSGDRINKISVHHNGNVNLLNIRDIVFIEGQADYCAIRLTDNDLYTSSKDLKQFEDLLKHSGFIRISKSVIINITHIKSYSKGDACDIVMTTGHTFTVSRRKKADVLSLLKDHIIL